MKIFDLDSPLMTALSKVADLMLLNFLALICCIPIFTAGASLTALHYMVLKLARNEEGYIARGFFKSFKQNFKQATIIWLMLLVMIVVLVLDFYIVLQSTSRFSLVLLVIILLVTVLVSFTATFVFPVLAKFDNTIKSTIKNALMMSILQFPKTILMIIINLVPIALVLLSFSMLPMLLLFGMSVPAYLSALLYKKFFKKLEDQITGVDGSEEEEMAELNTEEDESSWEMFANKGE